MNEKMKAQFRKLPIVYDLWHNAREKRNEMQEKKKKKAFRKYGQEILKDVSKLVGQFRYKCVCMDGTLLGLARDGHLIPWDDDMDFVLLEDCNFSWEKFEKDMRQAGFWKYREFEDKGKVVTQSYKKKNVLCDFSIWPLAKEPIDIVYGCYEIAGYQYTNGTVGKYRVWYRRVPPIKDIIVENYSGIKVQIPSNYEEILKALYGENWKIPDPDFYIETKEFEKEYKATYFKKSFFNSK